MCYLSLYLSITLSWSSPNTAGEQTPLSKLKWRNNLETLVPKRLYGHGKSHLTVQGLAPRVVIDGNSVLVSWSTESMPTDALQEPTSTPDTHFQFNKRENKQNNLSIFLCIAWWPLSIPGQCCCLSRNHGKLLIPLFSWLHWVVLVTQNYAILYIP